MFTITFTYKEGDEEITIQRNYSHKLAEQSDEKVGKEFKELIDRLYEKKEVPF